MTAPRRAPRPQVTLEVIRTVSLTPGMVRVTLGGRGFDAFTDRDETDKYVKLHIPPAGSDLTPPFDMAELRERLPFDQLPSVRTYTLRRVDHAARTLDIDVVTHGDTGVAGRWAAAARPGDLLTFAGPGGGYRPDVTADHRLLIGDESALPAIAAALESLPDGVRATVIAEARSAAHRIPLPASADITWVDEDHGAPGSRLVEAVGGAAWPAGRVQVFAHGERGAMKQLRAVFAERGVARADLSLSAYWAAGRSEDTFQAEKRLPVGQIFPD
ncbi:NADPH-dependent ferric siderophore reductase [Microbacterium sp. SORGH_AS428]|uniref:siderophore-interacting protein n=1 Tax=Microbacterium sp. SORGH_AS_0428 TaxID=3041788 RepID=UPI00285C9A49|nr:siderophore-interacting protein [Microbacterium sp. SORGH_AS_0428]MDR6201275.1 NADPH-dependent ferric siderophore reductase [Microbacterium sp. SORGH_AS_0428]